MNRSVLALVLVVAAFSPGCGGGGDPSPGCVSAAGLWDLSRVSQTGASIVCPEVGLAWTVFQTGCDVTIAPGDGDPASGVTGSIQGSRLYARWSSRQDCYQITEAVDVTVDGGTMTGEYFLIQAQAVYPAVCPGVGMCSASLSGVRRAP